MLNHSLVGLCFIELTQPCMYFLLLFHAIIAGYKSVQHKLSLIDLLVWSSFMRKIKQQRADYYHRC